MMNTERALAYGVMESIRHMSGDVPRKGKTLRRVLSWVAIGVICIVVLLAAAAR